jgi:16S rRNA (adenine1518-N6/adenine1519-N6)-dimethyltransferase
MSRRLGQHFLRPGAVRRLLDVVDPGPDQSFLEIGPGAGALTLPLAARARQVTAVEIDPALVVRLRARASPNLTVVEADALTVDFGPLVARGDRLVGNLPYYISSPLLRRFLSLRDRVRDAHLMLQEEVARRVASPPGSKEYGILSVLFALWAEVDIPLLFGPHDFDPAPRVSSAILRVRFLEKPKAEVDDLERFEDLLQTAFRQRRRTLENNLRVRYPNLKEHLKLLNIEGSRRAETLSVVEFGRLFQTLVVE